MKPTSSSSNLVSLMVASILAAFSVPTILQAQPRVEIYHHSSTALGDILRAKADAVVALKQAQLIGEKALAQRLENMIRACDVKHKQFSTRNQMQKERMEHQFRQPSTISSSISNWPKSEANLKSRRRWNTVALVI